MCVGCLKDYIDDLASYDMELKVVVTGDSTETKETEHLYYIADKLRNLGVVVYTTDVLGLAFPEVQLGLDFGEDTNP